MWAIKFETKRKRKVRKIPKESKWRELESWELVFANKREISKADVKQNAMPMFFHWSRIWFWFSTGAVTSCDSMSIGGDDCGWDDDGGVGGCSLRGICETKLVIEAQNFWTLLEMEDIFVFLACCPTAAFPYL